MDELIPFIVNSDVKLHESTWCYAHKRFCRRGPEKSNNPDVLNLLLLGSPCVVLRFNLICFFSEISMIGFYDFLINMIFTRRETKPNLGLFIMGATIGSCWQECESIPNNATILISESFAISLPNKTKYIW